MQENVFRKLYYNILTEALARFDFTDGMIEPVLSKQYATYNKLNSTDLKIRKNDIKYIKDLLNKVYSLYDRYRVAFLETNLKSVKQIAVNEDKRWEYFYNFIAQQHLQQPAKLTIIEMLKDMKIDVPLNINPGGHPVYKFHLIHKLVQMDVLNDLKISGQLSADQIQNIEKIIFTPRVRNELSKEIDTYNNKTVNSP